jgi:hypothetical protein
LPSQDTGIGEADMNVAYCGIVYDISVKQNVKITNIVDNYEFGFRADSPTGIKFCRQLEYIEYIWTKNPTEYPDKSNVYANFFAHIDGLCREFALVAKAEDE